MSFSASLGPGHLTWTHDFLLAFIAIFVALDIVGGLPMFVAITQTFSRRARDRVVRTSMLVAFVVALVFVVAGQWIFLYLGIGIDDFRIAGGLVLLLVSLADLVGKPEAANRTSGQTGVVPLAVPLITGPAVLTTLVLQVGKTGYVITIAALIANYAIGWLMLRRSDSITRLMGKDGTVILSKIAALLLAAIAVAMIRSGVTNALRAI